MIVKEGGGDLLPTETGYISRGEARRGCRLACQVKVKRDMKIEIAPEVFDVRKWTCKVVSNRNVATFIKELKLALPEGEEVPFRAGGYVQIECPAAHRIDFAIFDIEPAFRETWDRFDLWRFKSVGRRAGHSAPTRWPTTRTKRASCCSRSASHSRRIIARTSRPGIMSSWIFNLKPGDEVTVSGPFGEFFARDTDKEMCFIGGGAGMAPMRSHIFDQLKRLHTQTQDLVLVWRAQRAEAFYVDEFDDACGGATRTSAGTWRCPSRSPEDNWTGPTGFIHNVLHDEYLKNHPAPEDIEYYMCGPGPMNKAVIAMLLVARRRPREHHADDRLRAPSRSRVEQAKPGPTQKGAMNMMSQSVEAVVRDRGSDELISVPASVDGRGSRRRDGGARCRRRADHDRGRPGRPACSPSAIC